MSTAERLIMLRTLGISPKVILPAIWHIAVAVTLLVSGHQELAWQYAAAALPMHAILGYVARAGIVLPVDVGGAASVDTGESFATEPYEAPSSDVAPAVAADPILTDEQAAMIARLVSISITNTAH